VSAIEPVAEDVEAILGQAIDYAGGREAHSCLRLIRLLPDRLSGLVPWVKGAYRTFPIPEVFEIEPHEARVRFVGYPTASQDGVYSRGQVEVVERGHPYREGECPRGRMGGGFGLDRWGPLEALYFFGYALSHYHALPFQLTQNDVVQVRRGSRGHVVLDADVPHGVHSHCSRQRYYFSPEGQLVRHDYHAETVGFWARGAHFWRRPKRVAGVPICLERHVVPRLGRTTLPFVALNARFHDAEVETHSNRDVGKFAPANTR
jgi:hypothetical protein